jgi:integrase/recombinase XerD
MLAVSASMPNRKVSIWMYVKIGDRWRYAKPVEGRNHKLKPGCCLVNGVEQHHPHGAYYIRYREGAKTIWQKCRNAADATIARERQEVYLAAHAHGLTDAQQAKPLPKMASHALDGWLEEYRLSHSKESHNLMKQTLYEFFGYWDEQGRRIRGFVSTNLIEQVRRVDLLRYRAWLIEKKRSPRTAANKMLRVNQFIRSILELPESKGRVTVKDGKFVEMEPTVFNEDELKAFFGQCDAFHSAVFKTYLMAGLRKAELENLEWSDVDFDVGTVAVSPKADFTPKDYEQRSIEVPDELLEILKAMPRRGDFVFANSNGRKYTHSWDDARKIAKKAKVEDCHPHRFRATYATRLLQNGVDLKTVQKLLGHKNLESTMRYLAKAESPKVRAKVNAVKFGA